MESFHFYYESVFRVWQLIVLLYFNDIEGGYSCSSVYHNTTTADGQEWVVINLMDSSIGFSLSFVAWEVKLYYLEENTTITTTHSFKDNRIRISHGKQFLVKKKQQTRPNRLIGNHLLGLEYNPLPSAYEVNTVDVNVNYVYFLKFFKISSFLWLIIYIELGTKVIDLYH